MEESNHSNKVDKRVLTSFLVKYFDANATFAVKLGVLETMASILGFSDDDRAKVFKKFIS